MGINLDTDIYNEIQYIGYRHQIVRLAADLYINKRVADDGLFLIEGCWAYEKLMLAGISIETLLVCPELMKTRSEDHIIGKLIGLACNVFRISEKVCRRISDRDDSEGCFLVCRLKHHTFDEVKLNENDIVIVLDGLEKPGNIGTIIRTAEAAGIDAVIICNQRVRLTNQRLVKASMGASFLLPVIEDKLENVAKWLMANGFRIILTDLKATLNFYEADFNGRIAVVAGNEITGISDEWAQYNCERVIIPMYGMADSLNVGFAATLVAYEASMRQKLRLRRFTK
jgi:RNA methyltransferase, TrmH family